MKKEYFISIIFLTVLVSCQDSNKIEVLYQKGEFATYVLTKPSSTDIADDKARAKYSEGMQLAFSSSFNEALKKFIEADGIEPNNTIVLNDLANAYSSVEAYSEAIKIFEKLIIIDPTGVFTYCNYARTVN